MLNIQHQENEHNGIFFIEQDQGLKVAEMTYRWQDDTHIVADHTWVDDSLRGQGVAHQLLDQLVAFAREKGIKIIPTCSYVVVMFQRKKEFSDVAA